MIVEQGKTQYLLDGSPRWRVSHVCDALSRLDSDSLVYAGGSWAAAHALQINRDCLIDGVHPMGVDKWCGATGLSLADYIVSPEYKAHVAASVAKEQQRAADRGTLTNLCLDAYIAGAIGRDDAAEFLDTEIQRRFAECELAYREWQIASDQGLATEKDRPARGYQASVDDVLPYAESVLSFWEHSGLYVTESQTFVHDDLVAGTLDYVVEVDGKFMVLDLKTRNAASVRRSDCAQIATYTRLWASGMGYGPDRMKYGGVILCTPEKSNVRWMSQTGYADGLRDFALALAIIQNSGTKGRFLTTARTKELASA